MAATKERKPSNPDGEYTINSTNEASNQDGILSAYRTLEPRVRDVVLLIYLGIVVTN
jgi:hypothetical protein